MSCTESLAHGFASRRRLWLFALLVVAVVVSASVATPVAAHAYLSDSDPANGEQVEALPDEITLTFSGDGVQTADVTVTGPDGADVSGDATVDSDDSQLVHTPLESATDGEAAEGMYSVQWEILADDGHTVTGSFVFSVGDEPLDRDAVLEAYADDETDEGVPPGETAAKGLLLVALVGLVGGPITAGVAVYPIADRVGSSTRSVDRRLKRLLAVASALLFVAVSALGLTRATTVGSLSPTTILEFAGMPLGRAWLVQLALAAAVLTLLGAAVVGRLPRRVWLGGSLAGALGVGAAVSWGSHSATAIDRLQGTVLDFAHVAGAGLWVGGLVVLALVVPLLLRETAPADRTSAAASAIRRYSLLALAGVTLAVATGLGLASWHVPSLAALGESVYGAALSVKTLLVLLGLGLGGFTRLVLLRRLESPDGADRDGVLGSVLGGAGTRICEDGGQSADGAIAVFIRAVRFEVAILVLIVLLSGLLTSVPTAAVVGGDDGPGTATIEREGDVDLELTATPADREANDERFRLQQGEPVVLEVAFTDGDDYLESERVVRLLAESEAGDRFQIELDETEDGTYATVQTLPSDGDWELRITGEPGGEFVAQTVDAHVESDAGTHDHDETDHSTGSDASPFATLLQFGAVAVGVVGSVAVAVEATQFRKRS
ncbi:copper resistance protein CopC [Natrinema pellirubrum DSM 15624]|uniref:Copper export protein n=1 Tax=Natrinema pellirubrum (strain DSM 15624 / CIP 106293 / JCM 10476 / NCIMB 786 / 157) TaxID=797303 RepID=L0JMN8_NATP1|nr:FixH family protein [Natrinema pellirubrum]AGB31827.1 putative copper export protein [Natrinema pellirubrum DSM 15624]ELY77392.1 copper resistance protein CopC [Natrinema pellirubrum DSM 15624]